MFETTAGGIMVTDASNQIRTVSPAFSRITGYTPDEVIGRDPRLLSSGRHGPEFYRDMWRALIEKGHWSGEMWNRRKNGKVYPPLTGLPNRTLLFDRLSQAMSVADRDGTQLALLFIDLVRQSDTVARFGGDEFVIVLERVASVRAVATLAEKVIRGMSEPFQLSGREIFIGASVGISLFPEDASPAAWASPLWRKGLKHRSSWLSSRKPVVIWCRASF